MVAGVVGAVAVTRASGSARTRAILTAHGFNPDDDPTALEVTIEARGWRLSVEQGVVRGSGPRAPRWRALARRPPQLQEHRMGVHPHLRAGGPSVRDTLVQMLAKVLEREA